MINKAVGTYERLLDTEFKIITVKKGIEKEFILDFKTEEFHHLFGLHKLKDLSGYLNGPRSEIYYRFKDNENKSYEVKNSRNYHLIEKRIVLLAELEEIFFADFEIGIYCPKKAKLRNKADYAIKFYRTFDDGKERKCYWLLKKRDNSDRYYLSNSLIVHPREVFAQHPYGIKAKELIELSKNSE